MVQVRKGVFETNSSSTHSLVMAVQSEFDKWENGELYYCEWFGSKLKEAGVWDNSVIIVLADHGYEPTGKLEGRQNPILYIKNQ